MSKTRWSDIRKPECERREYESSDVWSESGPGQSYIWIWCPFCGFDVKAYLWSLAGCGKRCECGALFDSHGTAYKLQVNKPER